MLHDDFGTERYRLERVLDILEDATLRLEVHAYIPVSLLHDAVEFIRATEDSAHTATDDSDSDLPLTVCVQQHVACRAPLEAMERALGCLERGDAGAGGDFTRATRAYVTLRREHLRADDRLFLHATKPIATTRPAVEEVESATARRCYERLIEESAALDIGTLAALARTYRYR